MFVLAINTAPSVHAAEAPATFRAYDLLPGSNLSGPNYAIKETVINDGFINHYTVVVDGKKYIIAGDALMRERLNELAALQTMEKVKQSNIFKKSLKSAGTAALKGTKSLITKPVDTIKGTVKGVGSFFSSVGHSMFGGGSEQEESVLKTVVGFDAAKRKFAFKFNIDPYTSFPPVKERLDEIAWAGTAGNLTVSAAFQGIPAPAKGAVTVTKAAHGLPKYLLDNTPADLKKSNARKLSQMGVHASLAEAFLEHPKFSPTQKTMLVNALANVGISNREIFIQRAVLVQTEEMAYILRRWAQSIEAYHRKIKPVQRIVLLGKAPVLQRSDGIIIGIFPADHLAWSDDVGKRYAAIMKDISNVQGVTGGELWFEGTVSASARALLESHNWVVIENAGNLLGL